MSFIVDYVNSGCASGTEMACLSCGNCRFFKKGTSDHPYECYKTSSTTAAHRRSIENVSQSQCEEFKAGTPIQDKPEQIIESKKPMPRFVNLLIAGAIISAVWAIAIVIYGKIKNGLQIDTSLILTLASGLPIGTLAFTLLYMLRKSVNKGVSAQKGIGGNLTGFVVSRVLPVAAPVIAYFLLSSVFGTKIF